MKILIVLPNDALGGAEQYLKMVATYFKQEDVSIFFLKTNHTKQWEDVGQKTKRSIGSSKHILFGVFKFFLFSLRQKKEYDYIFTSHVYINALVGTLLSLKILKTKKFIVRESTSIFLRYKGFKLFLYQLAYKVGYKKINLIICQTEVMKAQLIQHFKGIQNKTLVKTIPNPINLEYLKQINQKKSTIDLPYEFIVSAGRLIEEKGYDILIDAFYEVKKTHKNLKLLLLGDGALKRALQAQIEKLNLTDDILLLGHVTNVYDYFKTAKLCVVSSRIEGFPNVLLQMMSQNNTVVSTKCAGGIDMINGVITAETNDINSLSNAILKGLSDTDNTDNRAKFDTYLSDRDINQFIKNLLVV
ncbi:MAG: glycosyltransferase [Gelidibacter sp.]